MQKSKHQHSNKKIKAKYTWGCQFLHRFLCNVRHEAYNWEDDKSGKHAGAGVDAAHNNRVPEEMAPKEDVRRQKSWGWGCYLIGCLLLLVDIVVVRVVASQSDKRAKAQPVGEEDLSGCVQPHLWNRTLRLDSTLWSCVRCKEKMYLRSDEHIEVWSDVKEDPIYGSGKRDPSEKQDEQHEVGIGGREINHLQEEGK